MATGPAPATQQEKPIYQHVLPMLDESNIMRMGHRSYCGPARKGATMLQVHRGKPHNSQSHLKSMKQQEGDKPPLHRHTSLDQALCCLASAVSFPAVAEAQITMAEKAENLDSLRDVLSGDLYRDLVYPRVFLAGSKAEGLSMRLGWGQPQSDWDVMTIAGGAWTVYNPVPESICDILHRVSDILCCRLVGPILKWIYQILGALRFRCDIRNNNLWWSVYKRSSRLFLVDKDCPAAYVRVRIWGNLVARIWLMAQQEHVIMDKLGTCMVGRYGTLWLSSPKTLSLLNPVAECFEDRKHGPAVETSHEDMVTALIYSEPAAGFEEYSSRKRASHWPPNSLLQQLARLPALLTVTGHKFSTDRDIEFRLSWSIGEVLLASSLPIWIKQGYWAFKYCVKNAKLRLQKANVDPEDKDEGRSVIGSYHLKTMFLWELEQLAIWQRECPFHVMTLLLERLAITLKSATDDARPRLDHYFLPRCDLLECVPDDEIRFTLSCVSMIQNDPLGALIHAPVFPAEVYLGGYRPNHVYPDGPDEEEGEKEGERLLALLNELLKYEVKGHCEIKMDDSQTMQTDSGVTSLGLPRNIVDHSERRVEFEKIVNKLRQFLSQLDGHFWEKHNFYQIHDAYLPFCRSPLSLVEYFEYIILDQFTDECGDPLAESV